MNGVAFRSNVQFSQTKELQAAKNFTSVTRAMFYGATTFNFLVLKAMLFLGHLWCHSYLILLKFNFHSIKFWPDKNPTMNNRIGYKMIF